MPDRHVLSTSLLLLALAVVTGCSRNPEAAKRKYLERGDTYFQQQKYDAALIEYRNAVQQDPRFGEARFKLAQTYYKRGDAPNAVSEAVRAADLLPDRVDAQMQAARFLILARKFADARARAEHVLQLDPTHIQAQIALGNALAGLQDLEGAIAQIEEAVRLDPDRSTSYTSLGTLQAAHGDLPAAEQAFRKAISRDQKSVLARLTLAQFLWQAGRLDEAEHTMKGALALEPTSVVANRTIAAFYGSTKRPDQAEPFLKAAVAADGSAAGRLTLADYYISRDRPSDAIAILESLASDAKLGGAARTRRAILHQRAGELDLADRVIADVLAKEPKNVQALLVKADLLMRHKKPEEALTAVDAAIASDSRSANAQFARGRILVAVNRPEDAKRAFNEVLKLNPRADAAQVELARLHLKSGATEASVALAGDAVKTNPRSLEARVVLARGLMIHGDMAQAEALIKKLVANAPDAAVVHAQMGVLLTLKKDPKAASIEFDRALSLDPFQLEAVDGLIRLDVAAGRIAQARGRVEALVARAPQNPGLLLLGARTFMITKDAKRAEALLVQAITVDPAMLAAYSMLGQIYLGQGRLDEARREFEKLAEQQSPPVAALTMVGIIQQTQLRTADARRTFERVLQLDARAAVAANNLAWMYTEAGENLDIALQLAQTAKAALPNQSDVDDTLGWIYYQKHLLPQAITAMRHSVELQPSNATYQYHLGLAYARSGDNSRARRALETALKLNPTFEGAVEASTTIASLRESGDITAPRPR